MTLAAEYLDRQQNERALFHLRAHVTQNPQALMIRAYLAELQFRLGAYPAAEAQFNRFLRDAEVSDGAIRKHRVHAHTRLMEIAQARGDSGSEALHRGIALLFMVQQWERDAEEMPADLIESTLVKAARALREAADELPGDPRSPHHLAQTYARLGLGAAADRVRRQARRGDDGLIWPELAESGLRRVER